MALLAGSPMLVVVPAAAKSDPRLRCAAGRGKVAAAQRGLERQRHAAAPHAGLFNQPTGSSIQHVPYKGGARRR
ncbi:MAG: hypothetical protein U1F49_10945 [Rubrivivax sp.]